MPVFMQKYKVKFGEEMITDEEILQFQDFNHLLNSHESAIAFSKVPAKYWKGFSVVSLLAMLGFTYYFFAIMPDTATSLSIDNVQPQATEVDNQKQLTEPVPPVEEVTITPEKTDSKPKVSNLKNDKITPIMVEPIEEVKPENESENLLLDVPTITYLDKNLKEDIFTEAMPVDGFPNLYRYFRTNLRYPEQATLDMVSGSVIVGFSINKKGKPSNIQVIEGVNKEIDREAIRLIESMPPWVPAMVNDIPITTRLVIPITFQLTHLEKKPLHQQ